MLDQVSGGCSGGAGHRGGEEAFKLKHWQQARSLTAGTVLQVGPPPDDWPIAGPTHVSQLTHAGSTAHWLVQDAALPVAFGRLVCAARQGTRVPAPPALYLPPLSDGPPG